MESVRHKEDLQHLMMAHNQSCAYRHDGSTCTASFGFSSASARMPRLSCASGMRRKPSAAAAASCTCTLEAGPLSPAHSTPCLSLLKAFDPAGDRPDLSLSRCSLALRIVQQSIS